MDDFTYDCWQKKQLAQQARHRKRGSKSRKCSLPSDNLTKKQWKERNGKTLSINLNQPTSWVIFKEVSKPTQEELNNHILDIYKSLGVQCQCKLFRALYHTLCDVVAQVPRRIYGY